MSKHATLSKCPGCGTEILTSEFDHSYNVHVTEMRADPVSLTPELETACIILARKTYAYHTHINGPLLGTRNPAQTKYLSGGQPEHILPAHICHHPLPGTPITPTNTNTNKDTYDDTNHPF